MNFIKEIFLGNPEQDFIHQKFVRYGRGDFDGPVINLKKSINSIKINASIDYVNSLGELIAKNTDHDLKVSGKLFAKREIGSELVRNREKRRGIYSGDISDVLSPNELLKLYDEFRDAFILVDISSLDRRFNLKTKKKLPKIGSGIDERFCSATFDVSAMADLMSELCFGVNAEGFKEIRISHMYRINHLIIPEEYRDDPKMVRIHAKRKGIIKRIITVDGERTEAEKEFVV